MTKRNPGTGRQERAAGSVRSRLGAATLAVIATSGFIAGAIVAAMTLPGLRERIASPPPAVGKALIGGPFSLVDQTGKRVSDADFRGRYMLILFGYTWCPDVCPSGLQVMSTALDMLGARSERIVPIFISLDPERDTPAKLAEYVPSFHPRLVGLTGSLQEVEAAARAYRAYYKKVPATEAGGGYTFDHSGLIYLMSPAGEYLTHFTHATPAAEIAARIAKLM